ncbi:hypothetical protein C492_05550 [Natronococcus jeotgali DSM 18795]|uniref:Uncharacterized protein n=1 Tax=Natronococcus jeotgali DSM 18795 TaxID=1227498 RepID=L9XUR4_9EURY|nr:hypothetical protein C492_05550 [Natronococcus jeotgali DSM 18795]
MKQYQSESYYGQDLADKQVSILLIILCTITFEKFFRVYSIFISGYCSHVCHSEISPNWLGWVIDVLEIIIDVFSRFLIVLYFQAVNPDSDRCKSDCHCAN